MTVQIHVTCFALFCNFFVDFFFFAFSLFNFWFHRYDKNSFFSFSIAWQIVQDFGNTLFPFLWKLVSFKLSWLRLINRIFAVIFWAFITNFISRIWSSFIRQYHHSPLVFLWTLPWFLNITQFSTVYALSIGFSFSNNGTQLQLPMVSSNFLFCRIHTHLQMYTTLFFSRIIFFYRRTFRN